MGVAWDEFIRAPEASQHGVQVYADLDELAESVAAYLAAGFGAGEPAVVVATPEHLESFARRLAASGWTADRIEEHGLLAVADAEATLAEFMRRDQPSARAFEQVVGGILDGVTARFPGRRIRAFGEMVDVLCERGQPEAAVALERLWNDLARTRSFSLLCGYHLNLFDRAAQATLLPDVCEVHSHVQPAHDADRLARAVEQALEEVLGPVQAGEVYVLIGRQIRRERVPVPQLVLMWVSENMPVLANRVLAAARANYSSEPAVSAGV